MDDPIVLTVLIGVAAAVLIGGLGLVMLRPGRAEADRRLDALTSGRSLRKGGDPAKSAELLMRPPELDEGQIERLRRLLPSIDGLRRLHERADVRLPFERFLMLMGGLAAAGGLVGAFLVPIVLVPVAALFAAATPVLWLSHRAKRRLRQFLDAMPEAVELIGRALRAGHGLASGMNLVSDEMKGPVAEEFGRVFEEQNLGVPLEVALRGLADRMPSMDVRFFVTAVIIQRATGGDLAEVLDKIGRLIRQRFELFGHVRALTAEGRLSGIVLLAMPPGLLGFLCFSNYKYVSVMFTTPLGAKMLAITAGLQVVGALAIKKIVAIKV